MTSISSQMPTAWNCFRTWSSTPGWPKPVAPTRTARAEPMVRGLSAGVLVLLSALAPAAEESGQLDADCVEYLAQMEGDDADWTLLAQPEEAPAPPPKKAESKTPQPSKQADKPAV